jgi:hypothetical protein
LVRTGPKYWGIRAAPESASSGGFAANIAYGLQVGGDEVLLFIAVVMVVADQARLFIAGIERGWMAGIRS